MIVVFPAAGDIKLKRPALARQNAFARVKGAAKTPAGGWINGMSRMKAGGGPH